MESSGSTVDMEVAARYIQPGQSISLTRRLVSSFPSIPLLAWIILFVIVPGGFMITYSFMTYTFYDVELPWTLENYTNIVTGGANYGKLFLKTALMATIITTATLLIASPFVYYIARIVSRRIAIVLLLLTVLPLWMNSVVRNYAWFALVTNKGLMNKVLVGIGLSEEGIKLLYTYQLVLIVGVSLALPFAVLVLYATMTGISHEVEEASFDLGSARFDSFRKVILPLTASGYQTATLLIFMPTLAFFVTPQMLGGSKGVMVGMPLMSIIKDALDFATGSAFIMPIIAMLIILVLLLRRGLNIENLYRGGVGSQQARYAQRKAPGLGVYTVLIMLFTYIPMFALVFFSFASNPLAMFPAGSPTFLWYENLFDNVAMVNTLKRSLMIAFFVALIGVSLCAPAAYAVVRSRFPGRSAFLFVTLLPMLIPELILGMAILTLLVSFEVTLSIWTIVLGHITLALPYIFLTILAQQYGYDRYVEEASTDLGASPFRTFAKVVLPLMVPGLVAAVFLAITISFNDFVIAFILTGGESTLPLFIFGLSKSGVTPETNALGTLLIAAVVVLIIIRLLQPWRLAIWGYYRLQTSMRGSQSVVETEPIEAS